MQLHRKIEINMPTKMKIKQKSTEKRSGDNETDKPE